MQKSPTALYANEIRNMVKLSRMGNDALAAINQALTNGFSVVLRSVNVRFILAECIAATCDFNLTRLNDVDYSLSKMVQKRSGGDESEESILVFPRRSLVVLQTISLSPLRCRWIISSSSAGDWRFRCECRFQPSNTTVIVGPVGSVPCGVEALA